VLKIRLVMRPVGLLSVLLVFTSGCSIGVKGPQAQQPIRPYFSHSLPGLLAPEVKEVLVSQESKNSSTTVSTHQPGPEIVLFFDNDSAAVRDGDLERIQSFLLSYPVDKQPLFLITGHTDSNSSDDYNLALSERRSKSTQRAMHSMGIPETRTAIRFLGETSPAATNGTPQGRQDNRRVVISTVTND